MCSFAFPRSPAEMALPISTRALVVPLRALSTTIFGSASAVISWLTWYILSGFPTEVPPNFMTFISRLLFFGIANIRGRPLGLREIQPKFCREVAQVGDDCGKQGNAFDEAPRFHFALRIAWYQHAFEARGGCSRAEAPDPMIHMAFEIGGGPEGIDAHGAEEVADAFSGHPGWHGYIGRERRHPGAIVGATDDGGQDINHRAECISFMAAVIAIAPQWQERATGF